MAVSQLRCWLIADRTHLPRFCYRYGTRCCCCWTFCYWLRDIYLFNVAHCHVGCCWAIYPDYVSVTLLRCCCCVVLRYGWPVTFDVVADLTLFYARYLVVFVDSVGIYILRFVVTRLVYRVNTVIITWLTIYADCSLAFERLLRCAFTFTTLNCPALLQWFAWLRCCDALLPRVTVAYGLRCWTYDPLRPRFIMRALLCARCVVVDLFDVCCVVVAVRCWCCYCAVVIGYLIYVARCCFTLPLFGFKRLLWHWPHYSIVRCHLVVTRWLVVVVLRCC